METLLLRDRQADAKRQAGWQAGRQAGWQAGGRSSHPLPPCYHVPPSCHAGAEDLGPQLGGEFNAELICDSSKDNMWVRTGKEEEGSWRSQQPAHLQRRLHRM